MDTLSRSRRSQVMASVRSSGTAPERLVRTTLHRRGYRFGRSDRLPGRPDVVLPKHRTVVFVNGCFWHGHDGCSRAKTPQTNASWWAEKVRRNRERDRRVTSELSALGWRVLVLWTCGLRNSKSAAVVLSDLATAVATPKMSQQRATVAAA